MRPATRISVGGIRRRSRSSNSNKCRRYSSALMSPATRISVGGIRRRSRSSNFVSRSSNSNKCRRYSSAITSPATRIFFFFFNTIFVSSHIYPENPEGTKVIVGSMNMGYMSDTARNRTHNLFRPKRESIPLGHSDWWNKRRRYSSAITSPVTRISVGDIRRRWWVQQLE